MWLTVAHSPLFKGILAGLIGAVIVDVHGFLAWKSLDDAKSFDWKTALLHWGQGAVGGLITAAGYGAVIG